MILFLQTILLTLISFQNLNEHVYYIDDLQLIKRNINSEKIEVIDFDNPDLINLDNYELMVKESGLFFISRESGLVYKIENSSLVKN